MYLKESSITLPVDIDWDGNPLKFEFRFILQVDPDGIIFGARFPKNALALGQANQFAEGLWEGSVVELFIHEESSTRYIEINLSPTGAYWIAEFSDYRANESELRVNPEIETKSIDEDITTLLKIELKELAVSKFKIAQTAVLKVKNPDSESDFYLTRKFGWGQAAVDSLNCEPDFHKKKLAEVL